VRGQVSHTYKTTGKIIVLYTLTFICSDTNWKTQVVLMTACIPFVQSALKFFMIAIMIFWSCVVPNNIKMDFYAGGCGGMEWIDLAQDRD